MALTKDILEGTANDAAISQANNRSKPAGMRADAVSLEVPVKVHGTRVAQGTPGGASEPFEEKTTTIIVFPQGGVLKMSTPVAPAQMMVVTNLKSGQDAICRVVKVRAFAPGQSYVEIEFTHKKGGYWGVYFPSDGADAADQVTSPSQAANSAPPISVDVKVEKAAEKVAKERAAVKPSPAQESPKAAVKQSGSVFAPIGSQEAVQPAAAPTSSRVRPSSVAEPANKQLNFDSATKSLTDVASTSSPTASRSTREGRASVEAKRAISFAGAGVPGEVVDIPEDEDVEQVESPASPLGHFAASANLDEEQTATSDPFGSGLGSSSFGIGATTSEIRHTKGINSAMLAVAAIAILALAAGVAYRLHLFSSGQQSAAQASSPSLSSSAPNSAPAAPQPMVPEQSGSAATSGSLQQGNSARPSNASFANNATPTRVNPAVPGKAVNAAPSAAPAEASAAPTERVSSKTPNLVAALKVHPKARKHSLGAVGEGDAPDVDASAMDTGATLSGIMGGSAIAPPPGAQQPPVRIRVGGALKPPQLVSSVLPAYPTLARETGIDGDVVIDTAIDKTGKVTSMKVISGPSMLRQAALDALRQWKYEPSQLNGEPVPVQMTVTIKFHRN